MRRSLLLVLLAGSLLTRPTPAAAQADPGNRLSLEALTAPQPGDGQAHHSRPRAYAGGRSYGHGGYGGSAHLTRRHNSARYYNHSHYHGSPSVHHARAHSHGHHGYTRHVTRHHYSAAYPSTARPS